MNWRTSDLKRSRSPLSQRISRGTAGMVGPAGMRMSLLLNSSTTTNLRVPLANLSLKSLVKSKPLPKASIAFISMPTSTSTPSLFSSAFISAISNQKLWKTTFAFINNNNNNVEQKETFNMVHLQFFMHAFFDLTNK